MKCSNCGAQLDLKHQFCANCGTPRPTMEPRFAETERQFLELKNLYHSGELEKSKFESELEELVFEDESGTYWMLGTDSGEWYRYDGQEWIQTDPPLLDEDEELPPPSIQSQPQPPYVKTDQPSKKNIIIIVAVVGLLALCCLAIIVCLATGMITFD